MKNKNIFKEILQWLKKILKNFRSVGIWNWIGILSLIVGVIGIWITVTISRTTDATIQIVDWKGSPNRWINERMIEYDYKIKILEKEYTPEINDTYAKIEIHNIRAKYKNQEVKVYFESKNKNKDKILYSDTDIALYCDKVKPSELRIYVKGFESIHGYIKKENTDLGIDSALVFISGNKDSLYTYTNQFGYFDLQIPPKYQDIRQTIIVQKENYRTEEKNITAKQLTDKKDIDIYLRPQK